MSTIISKMIQVMKDIGPVSKDQKNVQQGFKFRGIDQFVNALHPALVKNGVLMFPREARPTTYELKDVVRSTGKAGVDKHVSVAMEYDFYAEDGSKLTVGPIPAEAVDSGDKGTNKALSAALKYALIQTFSVPTTDMAEADLETVEIGKEASKTADTKPEVKKSSFNKNKGVTQESAVENLQKGSTNGTYASPNGTTAEVSGDDW